MKVSDIKRLYQNASSEEILNAYRETDIEAIDEFESDASMLHLACSMADAEAVALLLKRGINVNVRNRYGQTPLYTLAKLDDRYKAISANKVRKCADLLLDANANVIRKDEDSGNTPITMAGQNGRFELLESAAAHNVKMTIADRSGNNALHLACKYVRHIIANMQYDRSDEDKANSRRLLDKYEKSVKALIDAGLDADEKNNRDQSALDIAIESKASNVIIGLLKGNDPADSNSAEARTCGMTLTQAVIHKNADAVRANVELGADMNAVTDDSNFKDMTPLAIACYTFNIDMVNLLLELGADPNFKDSLGRTAIAKWFAYLGDFHFYMDAAIKKIPSQILKTLIKHGMDKNATINDKSDTPLLAACAYADKGKGYNDVRLAKAAAETLIVEKCDPNKSNLDGVTPLMVLCSEDDDGIQNLISDLLDAGADLSAIDKNGNTVLHYAAYNNASNAGKEIAELLIDYGFDKIGAINNEGKSALEIATEKNNEPLVKLILMKS